MSDRDQRTPDQRENQPEHLSEQDREVLRGESTPSGDPHDDTDPQAG
jgi:hypothetical protein